MTEALRVLVVDDERPARRKVRRFLEADPEVAAIYEAPDGRTAIELIREQEPDLLFLDIQMPGLDGFGVVEALPPESLPHVVFVTAYDEYALRAFEVQAVDYLLKPFDAERFERALGRAKATVAARRGAEERDRLRAVIAELLRHRPQAESRLLVEADGRSVLLKTDAIDRIEAARNYARVHTGGRMYRLRATLTELEARLDPRRFLRVSRSTIVNADRIQDLRREDHGDGIVRLLDGTTVRLSRRYRDRLRRFGS